MITSIAKIIITITVLSLAPITFASSEDDAIAFVNKAGLGRNLSKIALRVATNTQTYRIMVADLGKSEASILVGKHLQKSVGNHQKEWNKNLANSYLEFFSGVELNSIISEKSDSPYFSKFRNKQKDVGGRMQEKSNKLLQKIVAEALKNAFTESTTSNK